MSARILRFRECGRVSYEHGLDLQRRAHDEVRGGSAPILLSLEHEPVYTLGRRDAPDRFKERDESIPIFKTDRGGEITFHGPGQAVVYLILPLDAWRLTLPNLVEAIEQAIIDVAASFGLLAERKEGWRGVFVGAQKLASIGLAVHRDVTMHGLALNVDNDLAPFHKIHPCGLPIEMCSLATLGVAGPDRAAIGRQLGERLAALLRAQLEIEAEPEA